MGVVPIVNENDTISVSVSYRPFIIRPLLLINSDMKEIKFGDNDTLSAITSSMVHADYLFLLTDVDGLYTTNPRKDPSARPIDVVPSVQAIRSEGKLPFADAQLQTLSYKLSQHHDIGLQARNWWHGD